MQYRGHTVLD